MYVKLLSVDMDEIKLVDLLNSNQKSISGSINTKSQKPPAHTRIYFLGVYLKFGFFKEL